MKIGILGGTFNPIHLGHLILAQECWHELSLDKVIFVPAYISPHKEGEIDVSAADRLNMLRLALEGDDRFEISTYELDKKGISYSIDTIRFFKGEFGDDSELCFLVGSDWSGDLSAWKDIDEVLNLTTFVIASRGGVVAEKDQYEDKVQYLEVAGIDTSSTSIRERIEKKEPIDYFVPKSVVEYIRNKGLYRGE